MGRITTEIATDDYSRSYRSILSLDVLNRWELASSITANEHSVSGTRQTLAKYGWGNGKGVKSHGEHYEEEQTTLRTGDLHLYKSHGVPNYMLQKPQVTGNGGTLLMMQCFTDASKAEQLAGFCSEDTSDQGIGVIHFNGGLVLNGNVIDEEGLSGILFSGKNNPFHISHEMLDRQVMPERSPEEIREDSIPRDFEHINSQERRDTIYKNIFIR